MCLQSIDGDDGQTVQSEENKKIEWSIINSRSNTLSP